MSHIGRNRYNNVFFTNISGANWKSTGVLVDPALLEGSCAKAVLFATIGPHSTPVSIWFLTVGSICTSLSLFLPLDLILLSGLPGFDFWLSLKGFGLTLANKCFSKPWMWWFPWNLFLWLKYAGPATGCLDWPEDSANAKERGFSSGLY